MRELVFDTETTGLDPYNDRLIEIGVVEIENLIPTGNTFHTYINPQKEVSKGAARVHGITNAMLYNKPVFADVVDEFLDFIGDDVLVGHNAVKYDCVIINEELKRLRLPPLANKVVDTLDLARQVKKGGYHNLDALCRHFGIDNSHRQYHGALLDAEILAAVYLELRGGRQFGLELKRTDLVEVLRQDGPSYGKRQITSRLTPDEAAAHAAFVATLKSPIWAEHLEAA
jgi:DNA polymerase-3 subunit epsilon